MENISKELQRIEGLINKFKRGLHEWLKIKRGKEIRIGKLTFSLAGSRI